MPGGLMSLVSTGQGNIVLNGTPQKSFFKSTYKKYTNFGLQKFAINYEGSKTLQLSENSTFDFKILRYADLLMDSYISVQLPNIWSPIMPPTSEHPTWRPYEFAWIENLGIKMVSQIRVCCGNQEICKFSGDYMLSLIQRDFKGAKKKLIDDMSGNTVQLNNPAMYGQNNGNYPNAYYSSEINGSQPSILGRTIYIPINTWFSLLPQSSFPLVSLQYNELHIYITFRPINQLFTINDVFDKTNNYPRVAPNFNLYYMQMYRFLQPPPNINLDFNSYSDTRSIWNSNIYLNCTYCFLSTDEQQLFALNEQKYLIKQVFETIFYNNFGPCKVDLTSLGMVSSWLFYFQRSDANLRNEWSNYTNWAYGYPPNFITPAPIEPEVLTPFPNDIPEGPGINPDGSPTGLYITDTYSIANNSEILIDMAILLDGEYRENTQPAGVYKYLEKYTRTPEYNTSSPYVYNFCLDTNIFNYQPSGAMNMSRFNNVQFEFTTINPPLNLLSETLKICDPVSGEIIGVNKNNWNIYEYTFDLYLFEERVNVVIFSGGNCSLMYAN